MNIVVASRWLRMSTSELSFNGVCIVLISVSALGYKGLSSMMERMCVTRSEKSCASSTAVHSPERYKRGKIWEADCVRNILRTGSSRPALQRWVSGQAEIPHR